MTKKKKRIEKIKIVDLPEDQKISEEEIASVKGGSTVALGGSYGTFGTGIRGMVASLDTSLTTSTKSVVGNTLSSDLEGADLKKL